MTRWLAVSIFVIAGAFAASAYVYFFQYDSLPERIAVHWNIKGEPDRIVPKSEAAARRGGPQSGRPASAP